MELILVHGALVRDGQWRWQRTGEMLHKHTGIRSGAIALPSCGEVAPEEVAGGLVADAAVLRGELDEVDSALVVGHSYGGTVIAEGDPVPIGDNGDGTLSVSGYDATSFGARFLQDADVETRHQAWARVVAQAAGAFTTPTSSAGWEGIDSTYIICGQDRSTSVELQRFHASRATHCIELPTGHHPFISRPDLVVEQVLELLQRG